MLAGRTFISEAGRCSGIAEGEPARGNDEEGTRNEAVRPLRAAARELSVTALYRAARANAAKWEWVPYLRLSGRWLERLGFASGCRVVATEEREKLTLTIVRADERPFAPTRRF